ncbi:MAG TPA: hypothetical protein VEL03_18485 [Streptosporangiaceae bacterium]|nr:hypothetical protein [Streptosporangiaceae bacterium]
MRMPLPHFSADFTQRRGSVLALLLVLMALLGLAAAVGLAYLAGFAQVRAVFDDFNWVWICALLGGLGVSFAGYYYAYEGVVTVAGGPRIPGAQIRTIVTVDFGGFLSGIGGVLDRYALENAGASEREARSRVSALAGLELGVLALGGTATAIAVLALGSSVPPPDFTLPWAVIPVPGFLVAFWLAERYRDRFRGRAGWRGTVGNFLESIHLIRVMFGNPRRYGLAIAGMALFWAGDAFAAWAGMAAFGFQMGAAALFVGYATGMVFTRRSGPLAGAGIVNLCLPLTLWGSGAPLAVAVVGVLAYRVLAVWLPMPASFALLPEVRKIGQKHAQSAARRLQPAGARACTAMPDQVR